MEEYDQTILRITEGKGEDIGNEKKKEQGDNQAKKVHEREKVQNSEKSSPNPNDIGITTGKEGIPNPIGGGIQKLEELRCVKKRSSGKGTGQ